MPAAEVRRRDAGVEDEVALKEKGLLAKQTHGNIIRFAPPLVITREELDHAIGVIREVFLAID